MAEASPGAVILVVPLAVSASLLTTSTSSARFECHSSGRMEAVVGREEEGEGCVAGAGATGLVGLRDIRKGRQNEVARIETGRLVRVE